MSLNGEMTANTNLFYFPLCYCLHVLYIHMFIRATSNHLVNTHTHFERWISLCIQVIKKILFDFICLILAFIFFI